MQAFYWIVLIIVVGIAVFAIQNSNAPIITIKFLLWEFKTSLIFAIFGSVCLGILITLLFWIPMAIRASFRKKKPPEKLPENLPST